jgi:glycosyltransferase involved in cell wall biosynthesis
MGVANPWAQAVARHLMQDGFEVHVADINPYFGANRELYEQAAVEVRSMVASVERLTLRGPYPLRVLEGARQLRRIAAQRNACATLTLYGGVQAAVAWLSGVRPYVVYVVGSDILLADQARNLVSRFSLAGAWRVLSNGLYLAERATAIAPRAKVQPLYLGIPLGPFSDAPGPRSSARFVCSRFFAAPYHNDSIVRAIAAMEAVPRDFEMSFLSSGPLLGDTIALADAIIPPASRAQVKFHGGVSQAELMSALYAGRFYISATHSDGSSSSLLEAMAAGLFPIVSDIPANREWITDGKTGILFPPGDHRALARCMEHALAGGAWIDGAVEVNRRLVNERANAEVNLSTLSDIVGAACDGRSRRE